MAVSSRGARIGIMVVFPCIHLSDDRTAQDC
jgi:hypothetical protein